MKRSPRFALAALILAAAISAQAQAQKAPPAKAKPAPATKVEAPAAAKDKVPAAPATIPPVVPPAAQPAVPPVPADAADAEGEGLLQKGDLGFKFYTGFAYTGSIYFNGNMASIFRTIGVGFDYHVASSFVLEPSAFYYDNTKTSDVWEPIAGIDVTKESRDRYYSPSLGLYFYFNPAKRLYVYTGPRLEYAYHTSTSEDPSSTSMAKQKIFDHYLGGAAVLGLKYMMSEHFGAFGDFGLGYYYHYGETATTTSSDVTTTTKVTERAISLTSAYIGASFYF